MAIFAERLKNLRLSCGENQSDVAKVLGVSVQSYSAYEGAREPKYDFLCKLAEHYNVSTDYLLGLSGDPQRKPSPVDVLGFSPTVIDNIVKDNDYPRLVHVINGIFGNEKACAIPFNIGLAMEASDKESYNEEDYKRFALAANAHGALTLRPQEAEKFFIYQAKELTLLCFDEYIRELQRHNEEVKKMVIE